MNSIEELPGLISPSQTCPIFSSDRHDPLAMGKSNHNSQKPNDSAEKKVAILRSEPRTILNSSVMGTKAGQI